jgi:hypothetical protein
MGLACTPLTYYQEYVWELLGFDFMPQRHRSNQSYKDQLHYPHLPFFSIA